MSINGQRGNSSRCPAFKTRQADLDPETGDLPASLMDDVDRGLRRVLGL